MTPDQKALAAAQRTAAKLAGRVAYALDLGKVLTVPLITGEVTAEWRCKAHELRYAPPAPEESKVNVTKLCLNGCAPLYATAAHQHRKGSYRVRYSGTLGSWVSVYPDADKAAAEVMKLCGSIAVFAVLGEEVPK